MNKAMLMTVAACAAMVMSASAADVKEIWAKDCAKCHGADGKGTGPLSATMKPKPVDLTVLAKRNNGVFAADLIYKKIDGRQAITSHGSTEMPIWGCRHLSPIVLQRKVHRRTATQRDSLRKVTKPATDPFESLMDLPCDPEPVIQNRIQAIVEYLRQIQVK